VIGITAPRTPRSTLIGRPGQVTFPTGRGTSTRYGMGATSGIGQPALDLIGGHARALEAL
jgi:hypothetical protein